MPGKKKANSKQITIQKRRKRSWLTFVRMVRYGVNNFSRNTWLTLAATAVMTITLLIIFMTLAARSTLQTTVDSIRDKVDISIYVKTETTDEEAAEIVRDLEQVSTVRRVSYQSPADARKAYAEERKDDAVSLNTLNESTNRFSGEIRVNLADLNDTNELKEFIETNANLQRHIDPNNEPSNEGPYRVAIDRIGQWVGFAETAGITASTVFIVISSLIVFNTIRMAIFNRKEEIQMMKLIGAERSFIRGPFIVEAVVYGFIAAVIATGLGVFALTSLRDALTTEIAVGPTTDFVITYIGFILLGMILVGALIGVISSLLATRRYLKL